MSKDDIGLLRTDPVLNQVTVKDHGYIGDPPYNLEYARKGTTAELTALRELVRELGVGLDQIARLGGPLGQYGNSDGNRMAQGLLDNPLIKKIMEDA